jgi:hypothetical protein
MKFIGNYISYNYVIKYVLLIHHHKISLLFLCKKLMQIGKANCHINLSNHALILERLFEVPT